MEGKLVVIYGINNIGKTTQAKKLAKRYESMGLAAEYQKYPIYGLEPSGPMINDYLRHNNPYALSPRELQLLHVINRTQSERELMRKLNNGMIIVAEDYIGTGIAWGIGAGVSKDLLIKSNEHLYNADISFLLDGQMFDTNIERNHKHEEDKHLTARVRDEFLALAEEFDWNILDANRDEDTIHEQIFIRCEQMT